MLTPEREKVIKQHIKEGLFYSHMGREVFSEIDRLKAELTKAHLEIAKWDEERNELKKDCEHWKSVASFVNKSKIDALKEIKVLKDDFQKLMSQLNIKRD